MMEDDCIFSENNASRVLWIKNDCMCKHTLCQSFVKLASDSTWVWSIFEAISLSERQYSICVAIFAEQAKTSLEI